MLEYGHTVSYVYLLRRCDSTWVLPVLLHMIHIGQYLHVCARRSEATSRDVGRLSLKNKRLPTVRITEKNTWYASRLNTHGYLARREGTI